MPHFCAASKIVVFSPCVCSMAKGFPSIVSRICCRGIYVAEKSCSIELAVTSEADVAGAASAFQMVVNYCRKMFDDRRNRSVNDLPQAADGRKAHRLEQIVHHRHIVRPGFPARPASEEV